MKQEVHLFNNTELIILCINFDQFRLIIQLTHPKMLFNV